MLTRRDLLRSGAAASVPLLLPGSATAASKRLRPEALIRGGTFGLGVSAGQPRTDGAILWTRVDGIERSGRVTLEIARDADFRNVVLRRTSRAAAIRDFCVRQPVTGLAPGEEFFYRFHTRTADSAVGRLRTLRPPDSREPVRIGFFSCQKRATGFYTAHAGLAAEDDLDIVVCLGDYIYEDAETADGPRGPAAADKPRGKEVETLEDYRAQYRAYKADPNLQAMHHKHPYVATWDDHEVENDYAGAGVGTAKKRTIDFLARRRQGYEVFFEYHPVQRDAADRSRVYRSLDLGTAELLLLDQRQYRDRQACSDIGPCAGDDDPGRSILGREQRDWLIERLRASRAPWKVIGSPVMFAGLDLPTGVRFNADQWDGYSDERRIVGEAVLAAGVKDVTTITGDIHAFFAGAVTTDGRATGRAFATEFVGGSITSSGIDQAIAEMGVPASVASAVDPFGLATVNPHLSYVNTADNGYGVLELRVGEALAALRAPESIAVASSPVRDLARFRVAAGETAVQRL